LDACQDEFLFDCPYFATSFAGGLIARCFASCILGWGAVGAYPSVLHWTLIPNLNFLALIPNLNFLALISNLNFLVSYYLFSITWLFL
jgi:hypothetical protein